SPKRSTQCSPGEAPDAPPPPQPPAPPAEHPRTPGNRRRTPPALRATSPFASERGGKALSSPRSGEGDREAVEGSAAAATSLLSSGQKAAPRPGAQRRS